MVQNANEKAKESELPSSGVDALIAKLREEGVTAGRSEADKIVAEARATAKAIVDKANAEAREHVEKARKEAEAFQSAGEQAVKTAMRDAILDMKSRLMHRFTSDVKRLVSDRLKDDQIVKEMILEMVGRMRQATGIDREAKVEVILPEKVAGLQELRSNPAEIQKGKATEFVLGLSQDMLREGVRFGASEEVKAGIRVHVEEQDVAIDLTDEAIAGLLLQHLQPRFRAVLEGIVK